MRSKIALILTLAMALSAPVTAMAQHFNPVTSTEFVDPTTFTKPYEVNQVVVDADEATGQPRLEARTKSIIEADGLKFKDLNGNGQLDVYEDWRQDVDARVDDLLSQMTLDEEIGLLWHASTGGTFTSMYPYTEDWLYSNEPTYTDQDGNCYVPMYHSIISDNVTTYLHNVNGTPDTLIYENNAFQEIAESARLGVPVVLSCDRSYNTWAGMVNMPNYAFGIAHDEELLYDMVAQYAKEERAIGFHVPFHSYGVEIGSWYGDDVNDIYSNIAFVASDNTPETKEFNEEFTKRANMPPSFHSISTYDTVMLVCDAAIQCGDNLNRETLKDAVQNYKGFDGLMGPFEFTEDGAVYRGYKVVQYQDGVLTSVSDYMMVHD